jgi:thiol-disulfide isomerase/thioredoxin
MIGNMDELNTQLAAGKGAYQILYFTAPWCGNCKRLTPTLDRLENELGIRILKINTDDAADVADEYGITSLPSCAFYGPSAERWKTTSDGGNVELLENVTPTLLEAVVNDWTKVGLGLGTGSGSGTGTGTDTFDMDVDF